MKLELIFNYYKINYNMDSPVSPGNEPEQIGLSDTGKIKTAAEDINLALTNAEKEDSKGESPVGENLQKMYEDAQKPEIHNKIPDAIRALPASNELRNLTPEEIIDIPISKLAEYSMLSIAKILGNRDIDEMARILPALPADKLKYFLNQLTPQEMALVSDDQASEIIKEITDLNFFTYEATKVLLPKLPQEFISTFEDSTLIVLLPALSPKQIQALPEERRVLISNGIKPEDSVDLDTQRIELLLPYFRDEQVHNLLPEQIRGLSESSLKYLKDDQLHKLSLRQQLLLPKEKARLILLDTNS
jgi:hypothetical protein